MAGRLRKVGGRDEGLHLPLPALFPERRVPSWVCQSMDARSQECSARSQAVQPTLARPARHRGPSPSARDKYTLEVDGLSRDVDGPDRIRGILHDFGAPDVLMGDEGFRPLQQAPRGFRQDPSAPVMLPLGDLGPCEVNARHAYAPYNLQPSVPGVVEQALRDDVEALRPHVAAAQAEQKRTFCLSRSEDAP